MAYDTAEQEQVEALKQFWDKNGKSIIGGILIGLAAYVGYQVWSQNQTATSEAASMEYMNVMDGLAQNKPELAAEHASRVIGSYDSTAYAPLSALALARIKLEEGDKITARAHLKWAIEHSDMPEVQALARVRLAAVLLDEGQYDQALSSLDKVKGEHFSSLGNELRGDIYVAMQQPEKAQKAYKDAIAEMDGAGQRQKFLQMKLDDIAGL